MPGRSSSGDQRVAVVTGGGGGIGAAIAEELGRLGHFVVTMDPLVSLDGATRVPAAPETTADRIRAAGGSARASSVSVTDGVAVEELFAMLVAEHGRLDAVINVAGITRPTTFATGRDEDWCAVLEVHLEGYLNILRAALPIMAAAGHGSILGVTSGSGWRPADTGAYGCAKRAVAALTWELGAVTPPGVVVNAVSPIAVTRMVTAALERRARGGGGVPKPDSSASATGGLSLGSMPAPDELGPLGAHLVGDAFSWCRGQVVFAAGSEVAVVDRPHLLEAVRIADVPSVARVLGAVTTSALARAEEGQESRGGSNPRFGGIFDEGPAGERPTAAATACVVVSDRPDVASAVGAALGGRGVTTHPIESSAATTTFASAAAALRSVVEAVGPIDAVVVALASGTAPPSSTGWEAVLAEHAGIVDHIHIDAGWARAVADHVAGTDRALRLVTLTDATTAGGRSRAQAAAQLARAAKKATGDRVSAFAVSVETTDGMEALGEVVAHLVTAPEAAALCGAELAVGPGWFGLRSHPRPRGTVTFGGPAVPGWLDGALRSIVGVDDAGVDGRASLREEAR